MAKENKILADRLRRALVNGDTTAFRRLVKGGVDVNERYWYGSTLLHESVMTGKPDLVQILLANRADVNSINEDGRSPLHLAIRAQKTEIVKLLIKHGADVNHWTNDGKTALHIAAWKKNNDLCQLLLRSGADPNIRDLDGCLPMYWAARWNKGPLIKMFLDHGSFLEIVKLDSKTSRALTEWKCIMNTNPDMMKLLMIHGANLQLLISDLMTTYLANTSHKREDKMQMVTLCVNCGCSFNPPFKRLFQSWTSTPGSVASDLPYNFLNSVKSLSSICRIRTRQRLIKNSGGTSILQLIDELPVPKILVEYLKFQSELEALTVT